MTNDYLDQARRYVSNRFGNEVSVLEESIIDSDRFYCFTLQSNEFIRTRNPSEMVAGQGYTIINKEDNRFFDFGSRYSLSESLKILEKDLIMERKIRKYKPQFELWTRYDIQINTIKKRQVLIEKLKEFKVTYIIPEVVGDSIFRISKPYDAGNLEKRLKDLPVIFHGVTDGLGLIDGLLNSDCCEFDLLKHQEKSAAKCADTATEEDLKPIW
jgi:hypothetical protein